MTVVTMPDGVAVDFGDMPPDQIKALIEKRFPNAVPVPATGGASPAAANPAPRPRQGTPQPTPDGEGSIFETIMQGVTAGFFDELVGGIGGIDSMVRGGSFGEGYDRAAETTRRKTKAYAERNPTLSTIAEIGGALATLPVSGPLNVMKVPAAGRGVGNVLARGGAKAANAAATGAAYGGLYGAGTAEGGPVERAVGAGEGALIGGGLGLATPAVTGTVKWIAQEAFGRPIAALTNAIAPRQRAASVMRQAVLDDAAAAGISPTQAIRNVEMAQRAGVPMKPLDIGESTRSLGRTASNMSPQGRDVLNQAVDQRFETQADRLIDTITASAPGVNAPQKRDLLQAAARSANSRNYTQAYRDGAGGIWNEGLEQLTVSPDMQMAIRDATRIGANEAALRGARPPKNPFRQNADGTINPIPDVMPTLEFWDHVKRSLDGQIGIQQRAGNKEYASQLTRLKGQLVGYLDRAVPSYAQARQTAASFFGSDDALEAGRLFVRRTGDNDGVREAIAKMSPAERDLFGEGFATQIIDDLRNIPDRHTVINKIFQSPAARERFELALGPRAADAMEATLRLEAIMDLGRKAVQGNSTTAQQLLAQAMVGGAAGTALGGGDWSNPTTYITAALTMGIANRGRMIAGRANSQMARELAQMLASDNPQVVRQAVGRIAGHPKMMDALRRGHTWITRGLQPLIQKEGGAAPAFVDSGTGSQPAQADN